jgi:prepilin-type N-terminal cleavage/methylation domain-containing protein
MISAKNRRSRGVTLLELLVVLMILSIVLTAAVKTWDVTLERGRAQTTASKLTQIVKVIVGDPDYITAGQRADFGFVGDMGRVPDSLQELVKAPAGSTTWRGPYIRSTFNQSVDGYRIDGWGDTLRYGREFYNNRDSLWVRSSGGRGWANQSRWQTLNFPYSDAALTQDSVIGQVVDIRGKSPSDNQMLRLIVTLYWPSDGKLVSLDKTGFEMMGAQNQFKFYAIPQGVHRLDAMYFTVDQKDTFRTTQSVPVYPGIGALHVRMRLPVDWDEK